MNIAHAMEIIGPIVLIVNLMTMFYYVRPKRGMPFTLGVYVLVAVAGHIFMILTGTLDSEFERFMGLPFLPVTMWLFRGLAFQKIFAFFMQHQLTALETFFADMLVGLTLGYRSPYALSAFLALSLFLLGVHTAVALRFGRRFVERIFAGGRPGEWALYAFGAVFSFALITTVQWTVIGPVLYIGLMLFILWSLGVLCFTIINTHEKTAQAYLAETLLLQMNAMREQTDAEKKHRDDMAILRHDMRHEMAVMRQLFRDGKPEEAEAVYDGWQRALSVAAPAALCAEPMLDAVFSRFEQRAKDRNIRLYVHSDIPNTLPLDTIRLSVVVSNALENALFATDSVPEPDRRAIRVKLIRNDKQIGLEIANPCTAPVVFDARGLPVTSKPGHGIGVRSIASFAKENGYLLDFRYLEGEGKFTMRLVMDLPDS